jgi:hypothetical protein
LHEVDVDQKDVQNLPGNDKTGLRVEDGDAPQLPLDFPYICCLLLGERGDYFPFEPAHVLISIITALPVLNILSTTAQEGLVNVLPIH